MEGEGREKKEKRRGGGDKMSRGGGDSRKWGGGEVRRRGRDE